MKPIVLGIDGTGDLSDDAYHVEMRHSFVSYIIRNAPTPHKKYIRGPAFDGMDIRFLIGAGYEFVRLEKFANPDAPILLTGYSRGGAGVLGVAQKLDADGVVVDGMVLFDPVDRAPFGDFDVIPTNVLKLYQARRYANTFSRSSFNNCAHYWSLPTHGRSQYFWATHGAIGGVPWKPLAGHGEQEFISEGASELQLTHATYDVARIRWVPEPGDHRTQAQFLAERYAAGNHTHVTFRQDAQGAHDVWEHAAPRLREMGFLP